MSHSIFDALTGMTLEGSGSLTVQQFLESPELIQSTITIAGGPPTSTTPTVQCSHLPSTITNATINESVSLDEDDVFQCGRCKKQFSSLDVFMVHKRHQCSGKNGGLRTLQTLQDPLTSTDEQTTFEDENSALANHIHVQVQPQQVPVSAGYSSSGLPSPSTINQHIIVNEAELLPFTIETTQVLPLPGGLQTANFLPASSGTKTLSSAVSPLLTTTSTITTPLDVGSTLSSPQPLSTIVGGVTDSSEGGGGEGEGDSGHRELTGEEKEHPLSPACYNHEFFHGGMAKTVPNKNDPAKLKLKHKCTFCAKEFSKNFDLQQHIRSHTGEKPFQCVVCGRAFTQKSNVKKHMATHRVWPSGSLSDTLPKDPIKKLMMPSAPMDGEPPMEPLEEVVVKEEVYVDDSYVCQFCPCSVNSYVKLRTHMKCHAHQKVYKCIQKNCDLSFAELNPFLDHVQTHDRDLQYRCHTCSKVFSSLNMLGLHQHEHSEYHQPKKTIGPSYFRCTKCMNKYASAEALEHHLRTSSHHYPCKQCGKVFTSERLLRRHLHIHGTANLSTCIQCSKEFKSEYSLKLHQLIHTGEKPYDCHLCKTAFNRKDKLKRHMLIHEPKKFRCPFGCPREFSRPDKLRLHTMTHAGGRGRRGRGQGRGSSAAGQSERQIKAEATPQEDLKCSCEQFLRPGEEGHKCTILKTEASENGNEDSDQGGVTPTTGRGRPLRQAVVRRAREQPSGRRGGRKKRGTLSQSFSKPIEEQHEQQTDIPQDHPPDEKQPPSPSLEVQSQVEEHILGVPVIEADTEADRDVDTQNVEIIYIPISLPLSRPFPTEFMPAISHEEDISIPGEVLEGGPTITLDSTTSSILVGNSPMVPLVNATSVDSLESDTILKTSSDLQVIYSPATVQQAGDCTTHLVGAAALTNNHLHSSQLDHNTTLEDSQLASTHLTHLSIIPNQT